MLVFISLVVKCQEPILNWQRQKVEFTDSWSPKGQLEKVNHRKGKNGNSFSETVKIKNYQHAGRISSSVLCLLSLLLSVGSSVPSHSDDFLSWVGAMAYGNI